MPDYGFNLGNGSWRKEFVFAEFQIMKLLK